MGAQGRHRGPLAGVLSLCLWPRSFTTLCYSADGQSILAGGMSKFVCIYHVREQILMKKFEISSNLSLDAMEVSSGRWTVLSWQLPACPSGAGYTVPVRLGPHHSSGFRSPSPPSSLGVCIRLSQAGLGGQRARMWVKPCHSCA